MRVRNIFICSVVVFCASSRMMKESLSERPRMNASGATSMTLRSMKPRDAVEAHHLVERVVHRAQVGIDLLREIARQEAEPLARLDRRPHEHDAPHALGLQRLDGAGDGEVRLARARRADAEGEVVAADVREILALVRRRARGCRRAARARRLVARVARGARAAARAAARRARAARGARLGRDTSSVRREVEEARAAAPRRARRARRSRGTMVAAPADLDAEPLTRRRRRFSSSGPHRFASRALSAGSSVELGRGGRDAAAAQVPAAHAMRVRIAQRASTQPAAQRVRQRLGDHDVGEAVDERGGAVEVDPAIVLGAAGELRVHRARDGRSTSTRCTRADHARLIARACASSCACRRASRSCFTSCGTSSGRRRRRRARAAAVDEAVTTGRSRRRARASSVASKSRSVSPGKADDEIRRDRDVRPHGAQPADLFLEFEHGVAALHEREDAVRAALHRQVQVIRELRHARVGLDQVVAEFSGCEVVKRMRSIPGTRATWRMSVAEVDVAPSAVRAVVGVDVLAEQRDFTDALLRERAHLLEHRCRTAGSLPRRACRARRRSCSTCCSLP